MANHGSGAFVHRTRCVRSALVRSDSLCCMETTQAAGDPAPRTRPEAGSPRVSGSSPSQQDPSRSVQPAGGSISPRQQPEHLRERELDRLHEQESDRGGQTGRGPDVASARVGVSRPRTAPDRPRTAPDRPRTAPDQAKTKPRVRVSGPADLLAVVPHLLGFHPENSFVVIGASGPRDRLDLGFRYDLPDPPDPAAASKIAGHAVAILTHRRVTTVIGVGYGPGGLVTPVADVFAAAVRRESFRLHELLRVEDGRYWSYLCHNVACCPPEGVHFDYQSHPAAAVMTAAGLAAYSDREALARTLEPVTGEAAKIMAHALDEASERAEALIAEAKRRGSRNNLRLVIREGRRAVSCSGFRVSWPRRSVLPP